MPLPPPPAAAPRDPVPVPRPADDWGDLVGLLGPAADAPWGPEGAVPPWAVPGRAAEARGGVPAGGGTGDAPAGGAAADAVAGPAPAGILPAGGGTADPGNGETPARARSGRTRVAAPAAPAEAAVTAGGASAAPGGLGDPVGLLIPSGLVVPAGPTPPAAPPPDGPAPRPPSAVAGPSAPPVPVPADACAWEAEQRRPPHPDCAARAWRAVREAGRVRRLVQVVAAYGEPESWLDVEAGDGRFAAAARALLPYTAFDGTGLGGEVERARSAGALDEAYRGTLPLLAGELAGRYDVVGLLHQLGDCPDPAAELAAARAVLRPGGLLLLEAPDPACRTAALLGPWCLPHCAARPAATAGTVRELLTGLGFEMLTVDRVAGHVPRTLEALWAAAGPPGARAARGADRLLAPLLRRTGFANGFRIVARRPAVSP
ncbi:methyltransferase domain-containing protein [Streptomyces diastaticus]|uniref:methyltransferase domain-containing protein n=1 Tax=Streptomyces diastaticus TaxID=1956 RepID=UPI0033F7D678